MERAFFFFRRMNRQLVPTWCPPGLDSVDALTGWEAVIEHMIAIPHVLVTGETEEMVGDATPQ
jgi:hypothetical protein